MAEQNPSNPLPFNNTWGHVNRVPINRAGGAMSRAWALAAGEEEEVIEGTLLGKTEVALRVASAPPLPLPPKPEEPAVEVPPAPAAEEPKTDNAKILHDILSLGRPQGMASLQNDKLEPPPVKGWSD